MASFISNMFGATSKSSSKSSSKTSKTPKSDAKSSSNDTWSLDSVKKSKVDGKKYDATFKKDNGKIKVVSFGKSDEKDFTQHKDKNLRDFYDFKYKDKHNWNDLMTPNALSKWILWNKPEMEQSVKSYKKMLAESQK